MLPVVFCQMGLTLEPVTIDRLYKSMGLRYALNATVPVIGQADMDSDCNIRLAHLGNEVGRLKIIAWVAPRAIASVP